jgi:NAD+ synthase
MTELLPRLPEAAEETIHRFLRAHVRAPAATGVVVGLSGGIDSALCARLARDALGAERVEGVLLPAGTMEPALQEETRRYAEELGIAHRTVDLGPLETAMRATLPDVHDRVTVGNTTARLRMTVLYALARDGRRLVLGTGNKSELLMGYFTKWGDGGVDLLPLGDLYKTQLRTLAERLGLPAPIRERPPSAGFWEGQTDEGELGLAYADLDRVLNGAEQLLSEEEIAARTGVPLATVRGVLARVAQNRHKRRLPPIPKLSLRTIGLDWRD